MLTPGPAERDRGGRPGRDDGDRAGRHPAARAQRRARAARPRPCTTWATSPSRPSPAPSRPAPTAPAASPPALSAQVAGLELVTGTGEVLRATADENPDVLDLARVGLGALGVLTTVTFRVEPLFLLEAHEQPMRWDEALAAYDELTGDAPPRRHVLVPAHRPDAGQAQRPARRRPRRGRAAPRLAVLARRRLPVQHALRRADRRREPVPRA